MKNIRLIILSAALFASPIFADDLSLSIGNGIDLSIGNGNGIDLSIGDGINLSIGNGTDLSLETDTSEIQAETVEMTETYGHVQSTKHSCANQDYRHAKLRDMDFSNTDLTGCDFSHAKMFNVSFKNSILDDADFSHANIQASDLSNASISGSDFSHTKLYFNVNITNVDFSLADDTSHIKFDLVK